MFKHDVLLRKDSRYGTDDFILWPQRFSTRYCHLSVVRTKAGATPSTEIMWWDPAVEDFTTGNNDRTITGQFGHLTDTRLDALSKAIDDLRLDYDAYVAEATENKTAHAIPSFLRTLMYSLRAALERLRLVPSTFEQAVLAVRNLQRSFLETDAIIEYMRVYKPRMEAATGDAPRANVTLMGAYTGNPREAQQLHQAGIPYWYIRTADKFSTEKINELVDVVGPSQLDLEPHPLHPTLCRSTNDTDAKLEAIRKCSLSAEWYEDPYESLPPVPPASKPGSTQGGPSRSRHDRPTDRYSPYSAGRPAANARPTVKPPAGRDKFTALTGRPEMPPSIPHWEKALSEVDRSQPPLAMTTSYILPEPALLASPEDVGQRQLRLHHFLMLRDALFYRIAHTHSKLTLLSQDWRDVLSGKVVTQGRPGSKARDRTNEIHTLLHPALVACGIQAQHEFPANRDAIALITENRAKEIIWEVAETNFRFELVALDKRVSGRDRRDECARCFAGGMMMRIPIAMGRQGFAATDVAERHEPTVNLARLMCDWKIAGVETPRLILETPTTHAYTETELLKLELTVAKHYTQMFYLLFGRAAVIPMRLEHGME
ncbi:hypothetical protein B0H12DRAFT_1076019 [Mycena haematopus]|nr:hypothetical protein B0H12DRAFT_1076019 [Mycena haematopus]